MFEITIEIINTIVTFLFIGTSWIGYGVVMEAIDFEDVKKEFNEFDLGQKIGTYVTIGFLILIYALSLYLMVVMWINYLTNIV